MVVTLEKDTLVIRLPLLKESKPSKTGKTVVVATSGGNQVTTVSIKGKPLIVGVNAYVKA